MTTSRPHSTLKHIQFAWTFIFCSLPWAVSAWFLQSYVPEYLRYLPGIIGGICINWHWRYWKHEFYKRGAP